MQRTALLTLSLILTSAVFAQTENASEVLKMKRAPVPGGEVEYVIRGQGEPVLFIHGAHIAESFLPLMDEASLADYRLIRYHRRGYAGSTAAVGPPADYIKRAAADARALLKHVGLERAHIVGHSSGALIALQLALDAPGAVESLALLEPALVRVPSGQAHGEDLAPAIERYHGGDPVGAVDRFMIEVAGPRWRSATARMIPGGPEQAEQDAATFFELELPAVGAWEFDADKAAAFSRPVLFILGSESIPMLKEGRDLVHTWFARTENLDVPGVNHALQMQDPQSVAAGLADFWARHRATATGNSACSTWEISSGCSEGSFLQINGISLYYEVHGEGEPLLMLHGGGGSAEHFNPMLPELSERFQVITPDTRAQGRSTDTDEALSYRQFADDMVALLDSLGIASAYVGGWSDGAAIAIHIAMHHPERVRALLLTAVDLSSEALTETFLEESKQWNLPEKLSTFWFQTRTTPTTEELAAIRTPTLFVIGEEEQYIKPAHLAWQYESIPQSEVVWIPEADHMLVLENPDEVNEAFISFIAKHR